MEWFCPLFRPEDSKNEFPPRAITLYQKKGKGYGYRPEERLSLWTTSPTRRDILEAKTLWKNILEIEISVKVLLLYQQC